MSRNLSLLFLPVLLAACADNQVRLEKPRPDTSVQTPPTVDTQPGPEAPTAPVGSMAWDGRFDNGLVSWGAEWRILWDSTGKYKVIREGAECHWQAVREGARSAEFAAQATIPVQPDRNQEVHVDLWARYHFPVKPGQAVRISGWFCGRAEVRLGADFKTDDGPSSQVADIFSDWLAEAEWTQVVLDHDHPANTGGKPNRQAARLIVPDGAKLMAVWVQVRGQKGDQAMVDDLEVTILDQ